MNKSTVRILVVAQWLSFAVNVGLGILLALKSNWVLAVAFLVTALGNLAIACVCYRELKRMA